MPHLADPQRKGLDDLPEINALHFLCNERGVSIVDHPTESLNAIFSFNQISNNVSGQLSLCQFDALFLQVLTFAVQCLSRLREIIRDDFSERFAGALEIVC